MAEEDRATSMDENRPAEGSLISTLERIQSRYGYLPEDALRDLARETGRSLTDIYGVATFYRAFSLEPRGRHLVSVCLGTACHVRGGPAIAAEIQRYLGIGPGETTPDREFSLEAVNCLGGLCDRAGGSGRRSLLPQGQDSRHRGDTGQGPGRA